MRYVFAVGAVIVLLALGASLLNQQPSALSWAQEEAAIARIERQRAADEALAPLDVLIAAAWRVLPLAAAGGLLAYLASLGVAHVGRFRHERLPNAAGLLPVNAWQLEDVAPTALGAFHAARQLEAGRALVSQSPHTITYSPSIAPHYAPRLDYRGDTGGAALPAADEPTAVPELPGLTDLIALGFTPSRDAILLGLAEGGERITVPASALCHVALVGATGGGKSNLLRLLLPQLQAIGARVCLADPHHAPVDPETGEDWRGIVARLHMAPAVSPAEIGALLAYLTEELDQRIELRRKGKKWGAPLFLALDELPVIADNVPGAVDRLGRLLREGRKVSLYSVGASQSMLVKVIGGDSSAREAYRTAYYVGGDLRSASVLLDIPQRDIDDGPLGAGVALLRSKATPAARLVRVPYASNAAVTGFLQESVQESTGGAAIHLGTPGGSLAEAQTVQASRSSIRPEAARALALFQQGRDVPAIVKELRGIDAQGGRRYQEAAREVQQLLREALV